jgi:hypothetical protein
MSRDILDALIGDAFDMFERCDCGAELDRDHECTAIPSCAGEEMMPFDDLVDALGPHPVEVP